MSFYTPHLLRASLCVLLLTFGACERSSPEKRNSPSAGRRPLFAEITGQMGLNENPPPWTRGVRLTPEINPGGVGLLDYDNDGRLDILQTTHAPEGLDAPSPRRLWRQQPDGRFVEAAREARLDDQTYGQGVSVADYDNDGFVDVYFSNFGQDRLYRNNGNGTFRDVTQAAGILQQHTWSSQAAFLDYDRDGHLDLYVSRYAVFDPAVRCTGKDGQQDYCPPRRYAGAMDTLYHNNGDGTFSDVSSKAGITAWAGKSFGVVCADFTGDGWIDIYVGNDDEPNHLWVNQRNGTFVDEAMKRGCAVSGAGEPEASMGITIGDANGDGLLDLFMTHEHNEKNTLYLARSPGQFADRSGSAGMAGLGLTGWGCALFDADHDGDLDLAVTNGRVSRRPPRPDAGSGSYWNGYAENNNLFLNDGAARFADATQGAGGFAARVEPGRGLSVGDIDNDGDLDIVTQGVDNTLRVYRNDAPPADRNWLKIRAMVGKRDALGALLTIHTPTRRIVRPVYSNFSSGSSMPAVVHVGLDVEKPRLIEVLWPDGSRDSLGTDAVKELITLHHKTVNAD